MVTIKTDSAMKKTVLLMIAACALIAASCNKIEEPAPNAEPIKLNLNLSSPGADTKAAKKAWAAGDKLNIWFGALAGEQSVPDLIVTFNGTEWTAGTLRPGCTPSASGKIMLVYEGFNDVSSDHYNFTWYYGEAQYTPKLAKEYPGGVNSYCRPLVVSASDISYTFSDNTLTATVSGWTFQTMFKVLIKSNASMDKAADYYNLQVYNTTSSSYAVTNGTWSVYPYGDHNVITLIESNAIGWTAGVQEADGIAFYYTSFSADHANITFTLKEYGGATKTYSVTGKTIAATLSDRCVGVALNYTSFE